MGPVMDYNACFLELLKRFVAIPSQSQNEEKCAEALAAVLGDELGMETSLIHVDGKGYNVAAKLHGNSSKPGRTILLGGHIDTVTPSCAWETDPFQLTVKGSRAYGLGAADMKGGLLAQVVSLKKWIDRRGTDFCGNIVFVGVCDEERHSLGAHAYAESVLAGREEKADFAVLSEPHYDNITVGSTGKILLKLNVRGSAGHAAMPESGVNAISCLCRFISAIDKKYTPMYEDGRRGSQCVLKMESRCDGYNLNIPEACAAWLNKQLRAGEDEEEFIREIEWLYENEVGAGRLEVSREIPYYPSYMLDGDNSDLRMVLRLLEDEFSLTPELKVNQSVSDANIIYKTIGVPVILFGPYGGECHKAGEYIDLPSAYNCIEINLRLLEEFFEIGRAAEPARLL